MEKLSHVDRRSLLLQRTCALFGALLVFVTGPLWHGGANFPQVPLFAWATAAPLWIDQVLVLALVAVIATVFMAPNSIATRPRAKWLCGGACVVWWLLFVLNQHRLQPWAYQFSLLLLMLATLPSRRALHFARALAASVYIYSAIGKFNESFYSGIGANFVDDGLRWLADTSQWPAAVRDLLVRAMPLGELAVGLMLAITTYGLYQWKDQTHPWWLRLVRRVGLVGACGMHILLLAVLGSWGLGHHWGVLLWNLYFLAQALILFAKPPPQDDPSTSPIGPTGILTTGVVLVALIMPATTAMGWWDHWLSWGLYSPRHGVVQVFVHPSRVEQLPENLRRAIVETSDEDYRRVDLNQWSLKTLRAPVYPSDRFQAALAIYIAGLPSMEGAVTAGWAPPAVGKRTYETFSSRELPRLREKFIFNAKPRN